MDNDQVLARSLTQLTREWDDRISTNFDAISLCECYVIDSDYLSLEMSASVSVINFNLFLSREMFPLSQC